MKNQELMSEWLQEHIECIGQSLDGFKKPYTAAQLKKMEVPKAQLKVIYDFVCKFDIDIDYQVYEKYLHFLN